MKSYAIPESPIKSVVNMKSAKEFIPMSNNFLLSVNCTKEELKSFLIINLN